MWRFWFFESMEEAGLVAALERINADYLAHAHAARRVAAEYFAADKVLPRLLQDAGVE